MNILELTKKAAVTIPLITISVSAFAQISADYQVNNSSGTFYDNSIGVNLLTTGQSSLASVTAPQGSLSGTFPLSGLNDGSGAGNANYTYYSVTMSPGDTGAALMPDTITFQLSQGYDITSIEAISGWGDHNLGEQNFELYLSIAGGVFTSYGTFVNNSSITTGNAPGSYLTTITDGSGTIASDVTGIRFIFSNPDTSLGTGTVGTSQAGGGSNGGTVIHELEAFGSPTIVPEPSTLALFGLAGVGLIVMRRRLAC